MKTKSRLLALITLLILSVLFNSSCNAKEGVVDELTNENEETISDLTNAADPVKYKYVIGINCLIYEDGGSMDATERELAFLDNLSLIAVPVIEEGMAFDHWTVNGVPVESQDQELHAHINENTVIQAVLREELNVSSTNAFMQLLDDKDNPEGDKLYELVFEHDEEQFPEKLVSLYVNAEIPSGYAIDYWLINSVPYYFNRAVTSFKVYDLDKTTVYEAVLIKTAAITAPTPTPTPTVAPVEMVSVSCTNATFSGGGYFGVTSGSVAKGTTITLTGLVDMGNPQVWEINGLATMDYGKTFSYKVNGDTTFRYTGIN